MGKLTRITRPLKIHHLKLVSHGFPLTKWELSISRGSLRVPLWFSAKVKGYPAELQARLWCLGGMSCSPFGVSRDPLGSELELPGCCYQLPVNTWLLI